MVNIFHSLRANKVCRTLASKLWSFIAFLISAVYILWATPSAAGPRQLLIALWLQILGIVASKSCQFWYPNFWFCMLGGFTLASWGTLGGPWDIGEHHKGYFEVQAWMFIDFFWFKDFVFSFVWVLGSKKVYLAVLVFRLLFLQFRRYPSQFHNWDRKRLTAGTRHSRRGSYFEPLPRTALWSTHGNRLERASNLVQQFLKANLQGVRGRMRRGFWGRHRQCFHHGLP